MEWILPLIAGLGIGSLLKSVADYFMTRRAGIRDRWYQEKREAYLGLLNSLHEAAVKPSNARSKAYVLWQTRCELFGSKEVARYAQEIIDTNDGPRTAREAAFRNLLDTMRIDLRST